MTVIRQSTVIDARPEEVWRVIADPRNLPRWNSLIKAVRGVPPDGLKPGDRYSTEIGALGVRFKVSARVLEIDPPRSSMIRLSGPLQATVRTWLRPVGKNRTRLEHEVDYKLKGGPVGSLVTRGVRVLGAPTILKRGIRAQKRQVERG
ncbi:MAG TPA: SRPBCC family protein [Actinomycetota bacterium]|nr:SRPBCC family protein [Actinomycetota bacterium]